MIFLVHQPECPSDMQRGVDAARAWCCKWRVQANIGPPKSAVMVFAPEHPLAMALATPDQQKPVEDYIAWVKSRSERERMAEKKISGVFTGSYAEHPFEPNRKIPIWIADYVMISYGTGAIMAVPYGDQRDFEFARKFGLDIVAVVKPEDADAVAIVILVSPATDVPLKVLAPFDFSLLVTMYSSMIILPSVGFFPTTSSIVILFYFTKY